MKFERLGKQIDILIEKADSAKVESNAELERDYLLKAASVMKKMSEELVKRVELAKKELNVKGKEK